MTSFAYKFVLAIGLSVFCIASFAANEPQIGTTASIRPGEPVPKAPEGTMWRVERHVQNMTMSMPGMPRLPRGPILQVVLVQMDREHAGDLFRSTDVGGFLPPSNSFFQLRLASDAQGNQYLETYQKFVALLTDKFIVGQTTRSEREPEKLPNLPEGYVWEEQSRVAGVGTLISSLGGGFTSSKDRVTYVLQKTQAELPDQFELPRVVSGFAKSQSAFEKSLTCGAMLTGNQDEE